MYKNIKVIAFDADDTLWVNEPYFRDVEHEFSKLLSTYETENKINQELFKKEMDNLELYGYGVKGFVLSMVESAIELSNNKISVTEITKILNFGKEMLNKPIELLDQERKLEKSGLMKYFTHIEVLSDKKEKNYDRLIQFLDIQPSEFLMIGNSLKSDVLPLINLNAEAIHVPFHTTWIHEEVSDEDKNDAYHTVHSLQEILPFLI